MGFVIAVRMFITRAYLHLCPAQLGVKSSVLDNDIVTRLEEVTLKDGSLGGGYRVRYWYCRLEAEANGPKLWLGLHMLPSFQDVDSMYMNSLPVPILQ